MQSGHGVLTLENGDVYTGAFVDDKLHGRGSLKYANGGMFVGQFENNVRHGQGGI